MENPGIDFPGRFLLQARCTPSMDLSRPCRLGWSGQHSDVCAAVTPTWTFTCAKLCLGFDIPGGNTDTSVHLNYAKTGLGQQFLSGQQMTSSLHPALDQKKNLKRNLTNHFRDDALSQKKGLTRYIYLNKCYKRIVILIHVVLIIL